MWCSTMSTVQPFSRCMSRMFSTRPGHIAGADPGHRLVEQHDARLGRQQHGDLELALVAVRDVAGGRVELVAEADRLELRERQLGRRHPFGRGKRSSE